MHASAEYRANLVSLYAKKAVEACQFKSIFSRMRNSFDEKFLMRLMTGLMPIKKQFQQQLFKLGDPLLDPQVAE